MVTEAKRSLEVSQHRDEVIDLLGDGDLRERYDPPRWQASRVGEAGENEVEGANAPLPKLLGKRFDAKAYERRQASVADSSRQLPRDDARMMVLFGIRAIAVSVLEVDAIILDGLATKLVAEPRIEALERGVAGDAECVAECRRARGELVERP
jgi:hypothetical protein